MTSRRFALALSLTLMVIGLAVACGIDEHYTGMGEGALPGDPLYHGVDAFVAPAGCGLDDATNTPFTGDAATSLNGKAWRFETLSLSKPLPDSMNSMVNGVVASQIEEGKLNLLMAVSDDDRVNFKFTLRVGASDASGDGFAFKGTPSTTPGKWTDARFDTTEPTQISIDVDLGGEKPLSLPIQKLSISGLFNPDGTSLSPAVLSGVLAVADAEKIDIFGTSLKDLLEGQDPPIKPTVAMDGGSTPDAYAFEGCFTAKATPLK